MFLLPALPQLARAARGRILNQAALDRHIMSYWTEDPPVSRHDVADIADHPVETWQIGRHAQRLQQQERETTMDETGMREDGNIAGKSTLWHYDKFIGAPDISDITEKVNNLRKDFSYSLPQVSDLCEGLVARLVNECLDKLKLYFKLVEMSGVYDKDSQQAYTEWAQANYRQQHAYRLVYGEYEEFERKPESPRDQQAWENTPNDPTLSEEKPWV